MLVGQWSWALDLSICLPPPELYQLHGILLDSGPHRGDPIEAELAPYKQANQVL